MLKRTFLFTLLLTLFAGFSFAAKYKIERVEPTFWWANMVNPKLELMVYGPNISELKPEIDYPGVSVKSCVTLQSPNYLFVELHLDKNVKPGSFQILFKAKGKTVLSHPYELKKRENGSANRIGFNNSDAIYLITPDRFVNGDESNDNTPDTKEAYYYRTIFDQLFPQQQSAESVLKWIPKWQTNTDPSGRAADNHDDFKSDIGEEGRLKEEKRIA